MSETGRDDERSVVVGVDIGGTKTALMATDVATGADLAHDRFPTPKEEGPDAMIDVLCSSIRSLVTKAGRDEADLAAVGVAVPGRVVIEQGRVIVAGNLPGWFDIPLRDLLSWKLGVPIWVDEDANAAALGERWRGCAKQMHNFVFVALGTGVGAGVVINGRLRRGFHNAAGEIGNFIMGREFLGQDRGGHGNLELLIGGPAIRAKAREATGQDLVASEALDEADEDRRLEEVADATADYLAIAVINIAALLDPEAVIFGGGTANAGDELIDMIRERVEAEITDRPAIMRTVLGEDAQLHGAVFGALWELDPDLALAEELR